MTYLYRKNEFSEMKSIDFPLYRNGICHQLEKYLKGCLTLYKPDSSCIHDGPPYAMIRQVLEDLINVKIRELDLLDARFFVPRT